MLRYEILFLTVPEITVDESKSIESQLDSFITKAKGSVLSYERWGKYQLSYPIRKYDYGIYFLIRFETKKEQVSDLLESIRNYFDVKQIEIVMRYMINRLDSDSSLEYERPESLEEAPTRDVDTFLKQNKMTGLINKSHSAKDTKVKDAKDEPKESVKPDLKPDLEPKESAKTEETISNFASDQEQKNKEAE